MLEEILDHLNNWFVLPDGIHPGRYRVEAGGITLPFLVSGQYFRISGSVFNDGLYQYPTSVLLPEEFDGTIWALVIPQSVQDLAAEIAEWQEKYAETAVSPYQSESFGGYSYQRIFTEDARGASWQTAFRSRLNRWRKI